MGKPPGPTKAERAEKIPEIVARRFVDRRSLSMTCARGCAFAAAMRLRSEWAEPPRVCAAPRLRRRGCRAQAIGLQRDRLLFENRWRVRERRFGRVLFRG